MVQKLHTCEKVYFDQRIFQYCFYYSFNSLFIIVPYFALWMLDFFQYHQGVKQFGPRSGPTLCRAWSGSKLLVKVISRLQKPWTIYLLRKRALIVVWLSVSLPHGILGWSAVFDYGFLVIVSCFLWFVAMVFLATGWCRIVIIVHIRNVVISIFI